MILAYLKTFIDDYKAWRRGLTRLVPRRGINGVVTRGRTHGHASKAEPIASVTIVHTRASDGTQTVYVRDGKVVK